MICPLFLSGQYFLELHSESNTSFGEWELLLERDSTEVEGDLELTWGLNGDFTEWQYRIDELYGEISQKFNNNSGLWELRSEGKVITMRQVWPGDASEWKISYNGRSFTFRALYSHRFDEWTVVGKEFGELIMYTEFEGDIRDWIISDYMVDSITFEERMAAIFIALYSSIPKI